MMMIKLSFLSPAAALVLLFSCLLLGERATASSLVQEAALLSSPTATKTLHSSSNAEEESPFLIILDGGSTGSRLHIFEFVHNTQSNNNNNQQECVRRGTARADQPLSAFVGATPQQLADHLMPTFRYAAQQIPPAWHAQTRVLYQATAGMRLLTQPQQQAVYDALYQGLLSDPDFVFALQRDDIATLSGDLEGYYGAVAANYLHGTINAQLELVPESGVVGALDMGGSSTQIVFLPQHHHHNTQSDDGDVVKADDNDDNDDEMVCSNPLAESDNATNGERLRQEDCHVANREEYPRALQGDDFFAVSYLSYGADQFRERLWSTWITEWQALNNSGSNDEEKTCDAHILPNPCAFKGYEAEWQGYTLVGTGEAHKCVQEVQRHIPHPEQTLEELAEDTERLVGGVQHPPVHGKFVAMSLYFFTLDTLRALSHPDKEAYEALNLSWPNPSIEELYNALDGLCSRQWQGDLEDIKHNAHPFTKAETLPHRCMEAVYIVTLLRDGFGFAPESRDITFTFLVDGSEVEWTLGMALAMHAEERYEHDHGMSSRQENGDHHESAHDLNNTRPSSSSSSSSTTKTDEPTVEGFRQQIIAHNAS